jgi:Domain of unknown function (DUF5658)
MGPEIGKAESFSLAEPLLLRKAVRRSDRKTMMYIQLFIYLQLLDFLTTFVGLQIGLSEASPFIRWMMHLGPAAGLALSKVVALVLGGVCIYLNKHHLVRLINYWYAGLIVWNICLISRALPVG